MEQKFLEHLNASFQFLNGKNNLIAISGGVDSVVITHLLKKLNYSISLAHCNFQLRGHESDLDETFVIELGKSLHLKTFTTKFDTSEYAKKNKLSTQLAARELRYNWFDLLVNAHNFDYLITAHHADDNIETLLINLTRGTGLEGLTGIPPINKNIVRPLLAFSREEILTYASQNNILWREDASNSETKYLRNKIRHKVIPILKEINPGLITSFNKTICFLKESQQIIDDKIQETSSEIFTKEDEALKLNIQKIKKLSNPKAYLYQFLKDYGFTEWNDVHNLIYAETGKLITTKSHTLLKDRDFLLLLPSCNLINTDNQKFTIDEETSTINKPISLSFKNVQKTTSLDKNSIYVNKNLLNYPLTLRRWNEADIFFPKGMKGKKKVSKYLKDEKLSLIEKQNIWLLCSDKNEIVWIIGKRQDSRFLPSDKSTNILQISIYQPL